MGGQMLEEKNKIYSIQLKAIKLVICMVFLPLTPYRSFSRFDWLRWMMRTYYGSLEPYLWALQMDIFLYYLTRHRHYTIKYDFSLPFFKLRRRIFQSLHRIKSIWIRLMMKHRFLSNIFKMSKLLIKYIG